MILTASKPITRRSRTAIMPSQTVSLKASVKKSLDLYFLQLDGTPPNDFYDLLMSQVEPPLLETVMEFAKGNQTKAAELLGISRGTLRKKLKQYSFITD